MRGLILGFILLFLSGCKTAPVQPPAEEVSAGMDKEAIRATIRDNLVPIRHCYEKELKAHTGGLHGKLVLEWDIEAGGKVTKVAIKKPFNAKVDQCIADVIKSAKFPEPPKGQIGRVAYPFVFTDK